MQSRYVLSAGITALMAAAPNIAAAQDTAAAVADLQAKITRANDTATAVSAVLPAQLSSNEPAVLAQKASIDLALASRVDAKAAPALAGQTHPAASAGEDTIKAVSAAAPPIAQPACGAQQCRMQLTAAELLSLAEKLVAKGDFEKAAPLVAALGQVPDYKFQHLFLTGYIQVETGKLKDAESTFRTLLHSSPGQTRIRLELARVLTLRGKEGAANYHYRLAQKDDALPDDIREAVTGIRSILRSKRNWRASFDVGFAPDTNINSATSAETVDVNFGPIQLPLSLSDDARETSGVGQTASANAGLRLRMSQKTAMLFDLRARGVNYKGKIADDYQVTLAAGPEFRIGDTAAFSVQALGEQRWFGGKRANTDIGARLGLKKILNAGQQLDFSIDGRRTNSGFNSGYSGWIFGGSATYERVIGKSFIASASVFGRRNTLNAKEFSNSSAGVSLGIGGELPLGLNAGVSGSVSRARYDAPQLFFSTDKRKDWRIFGRAYLGLRSIRLLGFSPSVEYSYSRVDSNYTLNSSKRHRTHFKLARYF